VRRSSIFNLGFYGGLFWRVHRFAKAGDVHAGHKHLIDHATLVSQGTVLCEIYGQEPREYRAPAVIEIDKDLFHRFTALEDDTVYFCVFATQHVSAAGTVDHLSQAQKESMLAGIAGAFCSSCSGCTP
jgi:hypothetical protein